MWILSMEGATSEQTFDTILFIALARAEDATVQKRKKLISH